jgi:hypothetical protein
MSKKSTRRASTGAKPAVKRSTQESIATLHQCYNWLYSTYAGEIAELAKLHAVVRFGAALVEVQEAIDSRSQIALTVQDRLVNDEFNCGLTLTFLDVSHPPVQFGYVSFASFTEMTRRFFKDLPTIKSIYQARSEFVAATGASPAQALPEVDGPEGDGVRGWFMGATRPKLDGSTSYYSLPQLAAMAQSYRQLAKAAVEEGTTQVHTRQETAQETAVEAP